MQRPVSSLVDDNLKFRQTLSDILRNQGYVPIGVSTGKAALDKIGQDVPAVALIDIRLEDMSGLEVLRQIKERASDTECILLTGYASQASAIEAVNLGAYSYVQKRYDLEQLLVTILRAVEKREVEAALRESEERYRSFRPYRSAFSIDEALEEISRNRAVLYDPEVVDVCLKLFIEKGFELK
ncbi:MAG: response regulator [Anaerolineales bacterium]|nr:response regulator [Anaerolineales bacterium]